MRDTHPSVAQKQVELLRRASVAGRFARVRSLSRTTIELSLRAIRRARPGADDREIGLAFVELHYGRELAEDLRKFLQDPRG